MRRNGMNRRIAVASAAFIIMHILAEKKRNQKKKRWWIKKIYTTRNNIEFLRDLNCEPESEFKNFTRMSTGDFVFLLNAIKDKIIKEDTNLRKSIAPAERLALTLRFLATGDSYTSLQYLFKISKQAISTIIPEVCQAIIESLMVYVKMPSTQDEWLDIEEEFSRMWNFPHCVGALDGKHVLIQAPIKSGSDYFNYKSQFSIVLLALVDAQYNFLFVDVGSQGRISDGGVFKNCNLYKRIEEQALNLPMASPVNGLPCELPFFFLGDSAFPLSTNIMKPYPGIHPKGSLQRIFNYRLSRARRVVENAFGVLSSVFRVLRKPLLLSPEKAKLIVMATVCLHNFLRRSKTSKRYYAAPTYVDTEINGEPRPGDWRKEQDEQTSFLPLRCVARKNKISAEKMRQDLANYFCTSGAVEWQADYA